MRALMSARGSSSSEPASITVGRCCLSSSYSSTADCRSARWLRKASSWACRNNACRDDVSSRSNWVSVVSNSATWALVMRY